MDLNTVTEFCRPRGRGELPAWRGGDAFLGGGTWLFSEPQPALTRLIDLATLGWPAIEPGAAGLRIGATCTLAQLAAADMPPLTGSSALLFRECCRALLGSFKIWNSATVGGNLCMALPAGPMAALAVALDATCAIWTPEGGERMLPAVDFVRGPQQTALRPGEMLRAIDIAAEALRRRSAFRQIALTPAGRSAALVIGTLADTGGFGLTVTAATRRPVRLAFPAVPTMAELRAAIDLAVPAALYFDDIHGAPDWRRHLTYRFAEQVRAALATGAGP